MIRPTDRRPGWPMLVAAVFLLTIFVPVIVPSAQQRYLHLNPVVEKLSQGKHVFGVRTSDLSLQNARSLARANDIDYVYLDMEHNPMRFGELEQFMAYLKDVEGVLKRGTAQAHPAVFARFAPYSREDVQWTIKHGLDLGLMGVLANNLETKEQAEHIVRTMRPMQRRDSKIPTPVGERGTLGGQWFWGVSGEDYRNRVDLWPLNPQGDIIFWPMIETQLGVKNADAIAQVPGVSGFFLGGAGDLTSSYGVRSNQDPDVQGALQRILEVCKRRNIACGRSVSADDAAKYIRDGYKIINLGAADGGLSEENGAARKAALAGGAKR